MQRADRQQSCPILLIPPKSSPGLDPGLDFTERSVRNVVQLFHITGLYTKTQARVKTVKISLSCTVCSAVMRTLPHSTGTGHAQTYVSLTNLFTAVILQAKNKMENPARLQHTRGSCVSHCGCSSAFDMTLYSTRGESADILPPSQSIVRSFREDCWVLLNATFQYLYMWWCRHTEGST